MDASIIMGQIGVGLVMGLATLGSALGIGAVGRAAAGAWTKEAKAGIPLNFTYIILAGMPLSQTIYAFVMMFIVLQPEVIGSDPAVVAGLIELHGGTFFGIGLGCGLAQLGSAWMQGTIGGSAVRALSEGEGKGLANMIIMMGICETVGLFGFVFLLLVAPSA
ncbi:MAG: V-type ATP synthase subunit K [Dehalococcoidia bacterium]